MASSFLTDHDQERDDQMKSESCAFLKKDENGHVQLAVMAYVDDLVISGSAQMVKDFILMIQEEFTVKHVNFLTSENPVEFLGRTIKRLKNGNITMEFSQKFIDELLKIFEVTGKGHYNRSQASSSSRRSKGSM